MDNTKLKVMRIASENTDLVKLFKIADEVTSNPMSIGEEAILIAILQDQHICRIIEHENKLKPLKDRIGEDGIESLITTIDKAIKIFEKNK